MAEGCCRSRERSRQPHGAVQHPLPTPADAGQDPVPCYTVPLYVALTFAFLIPRSCARGGGASERGQQRSGANAQFSRGEGVPQTPCRPATGAASCACGLRGGEPHLLHAVLALLAPLAPALLLLAHAKLPRAQRRVSIRALLGAVRTEPLSPSSVSATRHARSGGRAWRTRVSRYFGSNFFAAWMLS